MPSDHKTVSFLKQFATNSAKTMLLPHLAKYLDTKTKCYFLQSIIGQCVSLPTSTTLQSYTNIPNMHHISYGRTQVT